jgi:hypothetical protein
MLVVGWHIAPHTRTSIVSSSWWWTYECLKRVEQFIRTINFQVTSSWFFLLHIYRRCTDTRISNSYHYLWHCITSPNVNHLLEYSRNYSNYSNQLISLNRLDLGLSYDPVLNGWFLQRQMACKNDFVTKYFGSQESAVLACSKVLSRIQLRQLRRASVVYVTLARQICEVVCNHTALRRVVW